MSAATLCPSCGLSHSPLGVRGICLTCQTIAAAKQPPSGLPNVSANGNGAGRVQIVDAISAHAEVDGAEVLDDVAAFIERFQVLPSREGRGPARAVGLAHPQL
jgi:hypothetical protein